MSALSFEVGGGGHLAHLAVHDDLTRTSLLGLKQDGVHPHIRLDACGLRLHTCARPISSPSRVTKLFSAMFCFKQPRGNRPAQNAAEGGTQQASGGAAVRQ